MRHGPSHAWMIEREKGASLPRPWPQYLLLLQVRYSPVCHADPAIKRSTKDWTSPWNGASLSAPCDAPRGFPGAGPPAFQPVRALAVTAHGAAADRIEDPDGTHLYPAR